MAGVFTGLSMPPFQSDQHITHAPPSIYFYWFNVVLRPADAAPTSGRFRQPAVAPVDAGCGDGGGDRDRDRGKRGDGGRLGPPDAAIAGAGERDGSAEPSDHELPDEPDLRDRELLHRGVVRQRDRGGLTWG